MTMIGIFDLAHLKKFNNVLEVGAANEMLADKVEPLAKEGKFVLTLGGDHRFEACNFLFGINSVGIGSIAGILRARPNVGVIWVVCWFVCGKNV